MRRTADGPALLVIALGGLLSIPLGQSMAGRRGVENLAVAAPDPRAVPPSLECQAPFFLSAPPGRPGGRYHGHASLAPDGLAIVFEGWLGPGWLRPDRESDVRSVVFGLAQPTRNGGWRITHRAEPIALGRVAPGATRQLQSDALLIPGVGLAELTDGWLVVEHQLEQPDPYAGSALIHQHADRSAFLPLWSGQCIFRPLSGSSLAESLLP